MVRMNHQTFPLWRGIWERDYMTSYHSNEDQLLISHGGNLLALGVTPPSLQVAMIKIAMKQ